MRSQEKTIIDPQLGKVLFRKNARAKRYIIRVSGDSVTVVIPFLGSYKIAERFFESNRNEIEAALNKKKLQEKPQYNELVLRKQAKAYLPGKLAQLAQSHGFTYNALRIQKSRTRWGSCSSKKNINLSIFLMLLPEHLIEYVILHELCHTIEMNHSPAFWNLLDRHTSNRAKALRKELKSYTSYI